MYSCNLINTAKFIRPLRGGEDADSGFTQNDKPHDRATATSHATANRYKEGPICKAK